MRISRLFLDTPLHTDNTVSLQGEQLNYVARVLRLKPGAHLTVFNGQGGEYSAQLESVSKRSADLIIGEFNDRDCESPLDLTLVQGVSRGERMDYTIQKATELGVTRIIPVFTQRSMVSLDGERLEKRQHHWQGVVRSACEQCGRNRLPIIESAMALPEYLEQDVAGTKLLLDPRANDSLHAMSAPGGCTYLLIGPEGGLDDQERVLARSRGYTGIRLGPRVLRTETAAVACIAAMQTLWGDLR
jgi:16S rRNA (uracil1498-N3)-methyltransferase